MKSFVFKIFLISALIVSSIAAVFILVPGYDSGYAAMINKMDILKHSHGRKIVFVGGSGLYNGLDCAFLSKELKCGVINTGVYAGYNITPVLQLISPYLNAGDCVIIIPEYGVLSGYGYSFSPDGVARMWYLALGNVRTARQAYNGSGAAMDLANDILSLVQLKFGTIWQFIKSADFKKVRNRGYIRYDEIADRYGDLREESRMILPLVKKVGYGCSIPIEPLRREKSDDLARFCVWAKGKRVKVFFSFPAYPEKEYSDNKAAIELLYAGIRKIDSMAVLGIPHEYLYPYEYFTDTVNHLTIKGRKMRTRTLLYHIRRALRSGR